MEEFKKSKPIKLCCDAYICKGCIHDLIENEHTLCPICKQELVEIKTLCEKIINNQIFIFTKYLFLYYTIAISSVSLYILYESL